MTDFDLLIIGAGPAGSFAAELLAKGGAKVALFDGRPEGEPKACGGGVTAKALKAWPHLLDCPGRRITKVEMFSPSGKRLHLDLEEPFVVYSRASFDSYLRNRAQQAGAEVFATSIPTYGFQRVDHGWRVQNVQFAEWSGKFLVGADGINSLVARALVGPLSTSEMGIAFGYRVPLPMKVEPATVLAFLPGWPAYAWAFPRLDHVSFGVAISQKDLKYPPVNQLLWNFINNYYSGRGDKYIFGDSGRDLRGAFKGWFEAYAARVPQLSPGSWCSRSFAGPDWALVGDAAGFVDPITDEGIYFALRSAELFANAYLEGRPHGYENLCRADFGYELERASKIRRLFYGGLCQTPFTEMMIQFAILNSGVKATLDDLISGKQEYIGLKRALLRNALGI